MRKRKFGKTMVIIGLCLGLEMMMAGDKPSARAASQQRDFTVAAVGDCLIHRPVIQSKDPQILQLADLLRKADCTYGNCETTFYAPENGYPSYKAFDPNEFCYPFGADELKWFGIDLMSLANNHIMDFEDEGMYSTINHLNRVGIVYAGAGSDLNQAARPGYFETGNGTAALISCSSWLPEKHHQASMPARYMKGKPGLNPINNDLLIQLDEENFAKLYDLKKSIYKNAGEILLYPIFLLTDKTSNLRGTPRLADPERGKRILEHCEVVSKPYHTRFMIRNGIGKIVL